MFVLGGDAFPTDSQSLRTALALGAKLHGAADDAAGLDGNFPSLDLLRMNLAGVRLDARKPDVAAEKTGGGFYSRALKIAADPARLGDVPVQVALRAEDCVFAFGTAADGVRVAALESCGRGTLDASAKTSDIESALLGLARRAAEEHGAEVESVRLTLTTENTRCIALDAVAVAKAMFVTARLTIRGRIEVGEDFVLRLRDTTCTGDGMIANLAAAQLRPIIAKAAAREFSLRTLLPAGIRVEDVELAAGDALKIRAQFCSAPRA